MALGLGAAVFLAGAAAAQSRFQPTGLTGMWLMEPADAESNQKLVMPLTPAAQAMRDAERKAIEAGNVISDNGKKCLPEAMPTMMVNEFATEILESPERVTIINEASSLVRSVYIDEKVHTQGLEPSWNGHSIGHWEGGALVIDTVNFNDKAPPFGFIGVHSPTTHLVERYRVAPDGHHMTGEFTFEDPQLLTKPWSHTVHYKRLPPHSELWEYACEVGAEGWAERYKGDPQAKLAPGAQKP